MRRFIIDAVHLDRSQRIESARYVNHGIAHVDAAGGLVINGATGPVTIGAQITGSTVHTGTGTQINY